MKTYIRLSGIPHASSNQPSALSLADWPRYDRQPYLTRLKYTCPFLADAHAAAPARSCWGRFCSYLRRVRAMLFSVVAFATLAGTALAQPESQPMALGAVMLSAEQLQWLAAKMTMSAEQLKLLTAKMTARQKTLLAAQFVNLPIQTGGTTVLNQIPAVRGNAAAPAVKPTPPPAQNSSGATAVAAVEPADMPDIRFTAVDGRVVDLASLRGKVVLIDFWATWCGPCMGEIPNVVNTYNKYHDQGFEIVGISFDTNAAALQQVTHAKNMPWPQYFDGKGWQNAFGVKYGIRSIPTMWLIDQQGRLVTKNARQNLAGQVAKLLAAGGAN